MNENGKIIQIHNTRINNTYNKRHKHTHTHTRTHINNKYIHSIQRNRGGHQWTGENMFDSERKRYVCKNDIYITTRIMKIAVSILFVIFCSVFFPFSILFRSFCLYAKEIALGYIFILFLFLASAFSLIIWQEYIENLR